MKNNLRILAMGISALAWCAAASAQPPAEKTISVNIRAQAMSDALNELAAQTGLQLLFHVENVMPAELAAPAVVGALTPRAALNKLLANSGLAYNFVNERTVEIRPAVGNGSQTSGSSSALRERPSPDAADEIRLTQVDDAAAAASVANGKTTAGRRSEGEDIGGGGKGIPEILVRDRRTSNVDIHRTEDDVQPYVVFNARDIDRSMAQNLEEFLKTRLPMNTVVASNAQQPDAAGSTSTINLRGLGTDETLILVNGRRLPRVSAINRGGSFGQPDINGIPVSAVERIEVLPSTASGIYGGGATGGVVNIILKSDFNTFELGATYENTFDTDAGTRRLDATAGFNLEGGKTGILLTGSYSDGNALLVQDRDFVPRAYQLYLLNTQDDFSSGFRPPLASTTNIRLQGGDTQLRLKDPNGGPSIPLGERIAHVPMGYAGIASDGGAALIATAGSYNTELPRDIQGLEAGTLSHPVVNSFGVNLRRKFTTRVEAFVDVSWSSNQSHVQDAADSGSILLFPDDPGNPFDNRIQYTFPTPGLAFDRIFNSENSGAGAGLIVTLPRQWLGQAEMNWGRSRTEGKQTSPIYNDLTMDADIRSGALDIFRDLNVFPVDYAGNGYLLDSPNNFTGPFVNTQTGGSLRLAGPTVGLPGGPLALSAFYEHRKEVADQGTSQSVFLDFDFDTFEEFYSEQRLYYAERSQQADSISLELNAPFVAMSRPRRFIRSLDGQFSVRHDEYRTNGAATAAVTLYPGDPIPDVTRSIAELSSDDYTIGLRYAPSRDLALRASYGTGFLPPSVAQITPNVRTGSTVLRDPKREGVSVVLQNVTTIDGGNPDLDPEQSTSLSVGLILTPRLLPGLRLSLDYTEIDKKSEISFISPFTLLADESLYPGRVVRAELTNDDIEAGFEVGKITSIDLSMINLARSVVRNLDIQLDYRFETAYGALRAYVLATNASDYITQFQPGATRYNNAGHTARLKWRGNAGLTFARELFSLDWNMQYFDSYLLYPATATPATIPSYTVEQGSDTIPRQMYHDVAARLRLGDMLGGSSLLADTELQVGIRNVFDASPPIIATPFPSGGYSFFGDPRQRRYSISVRRRF